MLLKKMYRDDGTIDYISLAHTGTTAEQNFSVKRVSELIGFGFASISGDQLTLNVYPEPLHYEIIREPGRWCLHCGEKLTDDPQGTGTMARLHVAQKHAGIPSPSANDPAGYIVCNHYECVLDAAQHEAYGVKEPARAPHFHKKETE